MIAIVQQGTIKPTVLVRLAVRCALVALWCDATLGMARDGAGRPDNQAVNLRVVRQADVEPHTTTLPVVDGKGISLTRLSTAEGFSQTKVGQIVQDGQGFMWFGTQYGLNRTTATTTNCSSTIQEIPTALVEWKSTPSSRIAMARSGSDAINF